MRKWATKVFPGFKNLTYPEHLKALNLPTLQYHRLRGHCIQMYKHPKVHYDVDYYQHLLAVITEPKHCTRGQDCKLQKLSYNTRIRKFLLCGSLIIGRHHLLHQPGFQHLIAAAPAAPVVSFCSLIYYLSSWHRCPNPTSNRTVLEKKNYCDFAL